MKMRGANEVLAPLNVREQKTSKTANAPVPEYSTGFYQTGLQSLVSRLDEIHTLQKIPKGEKLNEGKENSGSAAVCNSAGCWFRSLISMKI